MLCGRMCARTREATAEPAAGACGMRYPVESNGTFMETATSSQSTLFTVDTLKFAGAALLFLNHSQPKGFFGKKNQNKKSLILIKEDDSELKRKVNYSTTACESVFYQGAKTKTIFNLILMKKSVENVLAVKFTGTKVFF